MLFHINATLCVNPALLAFQTTFFKKCLQYYPTYNKIIKCDTNCTTWLVGQAVKTPPSHGGIRGSIPLRAADYFMNSPTLQKRCVFLDTPFFMSFQISRYYIIFYMCFIWNIYMSASFDDDMI